jgi:hypothetical protein
MAVILTRRQHSSFACTSEQCSSARPGGGSGMCVAYVLGSRLHGVHASVHVTSAGPACIHNDSNNSNNNNN